LQNTRNQGSPPLPHSLLQRQLLSVPQCHQ
jgi:hypothetical protein